VHSVFLFVYLLATARAENDKHARQAQLLWSACQSLHRHLKTNRPGVPWQQQLQPLRMEIENVSKAAGELIVQQAAVIGGCVTSQY
jgi:hypothetical protein